MCCCLGCEDPVKFSVSKYLPVVTSSVVKLVVTSRNVICSQKTYGWEIFVLSELSVDIVLTSIDIVLIPLFFFLLMEQGILLTSQVRNDT